MSASSEHHHSGEAHGSLKEYAIGLVLSIVLTIIPFYMVMDGGWGNTLTFMAIAITAVAQVLVQLVFFLHMNGSSSQMWQTMSGVYAIFVVAFVIVGSLWIFQHLNHNMLMGH